MANKKSVAEECAATRERLRNYSFTCSQQRLDLPSFT